MFSLVWRIERKECSGESIIHLGSHCRLQVRWYRLYVIFINSRGVGGQICQLASVVIKQIWRYREVGHAWRKSCTRYAHTFAYFWHVTILTFVAGSFASFAKISSGWLADAESARNLYILSPWWIWSFAAGCARFFGDQKRWRIQLNITGTWNSGGHHTVDIIVGRRDVTWLDWGPCWRYTVNGIAVMLGATTEFWGAVVLVGDKLGEMNSELTSTRKLCFQYLWWFRLADKKNKGHSQ